jgi:hypothetical protein
MAAAMKVEDFARIPMSFPTYTNVLGRAALMASRRLDAAGIWDAPELDDLDSDPLSGETTTRWTGHGPRA